MEFEEEFEFAYQEHFRDVFTYSIDPSRHVWNMKISILSRIISNTIP